MPIIAKAGGGNPDFLPAPAGTHAAVCCDIIDLGVLKVNYGGKEKSQHKVRIVWQLAELRPSDGKPFQASKRYTNSLHEKASLRKDLESWRGRAFSEEELKGFDLEKLLSIPAFLNIIHAQKGSDTYANVVGIMRLPKQMEAPQVRDYVRMCDRKPDESGEVPPGFGGPDDYQITDDDVPF